MDKLYMSDLEGMNKSDINIPTLEEFEMNYLSFYESKTDPETERHIII